MRLYNTRENQLQSYIYTKKKNRQYARSDKATLF